MISTNYHSSKTSHWYHSKKRPPKRRRKNHCFCAPFQVIFRGSVLRSPSFLRGFMYNLYFLAINGSFPRNNYILQRRPCGSEGPGGYRSKLFLQRTIFGALLIKNNFYKKYEGRRAKKFRAEGIFCSREICIKNIKQEL